MGRRVEMIRNKKEISALHGRQPCQDIVGGRIISTSALKSKLVDEINELTLIHIYNSALELRQRRNEKSLPTFTLSKYKVFSVAAAVEQMRRVRRVQENWDIVCDDDDAADEFHGPR